MVQAPTSTFVAVKWRLSTSFQSTGLISAFFIIIVATFSLSAPCAPITAFHLCGGSTRARAARAAQTRVTVAVEQWNVISPHTTPDSTPASGGCAHAATAAWRGSRVLGAGCPLCFCGRDCRGARGRASGTTTVPLWFLQLVDPTLAGHTPGCNCSHFPCLPQTKAAGGGGQQQQQPGAGASPAGGLFVCEVCLQCFPSRQLLEGHSAAAHWPHPGAGQGEQGPQQRKYACSFCPYTTNVRTNVVTHERTHTGEKPYACGVCCRAFSQMSSLLAHQAIHNRQGSYECAECGHACASRSSLAQHRRRRHPHSSARGQGGGGGQQLRAGGTPSEQAPSWPRQQNPPSRRGQNGAGETPPGPQHDEGAPIAVELPGDKVGPSMSGQQSPRHFLDEVPYMLPYAPAAAAPGHLQDGHHPLHLGAFGGSACPHWGEGCREEGDAQRQGQ